ncbi:WD repeat-containing protein 90 isoform X3 [Manis javanica]|uniref:WD repeat-containing protein 90 isoform X3 n=1 Tax=Manis javanica TaxID=9974 RepID=UPI003C6CFA3D
MPSGRASSGCGTWHRRCRLWVSSSLHSPPVWQHPFINVFRHFKVDEWKPSAKEGDVSTVMDKALKCTVYRIRGSISASNYIQLPRTSTQSLGLTGRYLYVLFRPLPTKHFVIHLHVSTEDGQVIRVSFSSLFKEFKAMAMWLQFPFSCEAKTPRKGLVAVASPSARWTCLQLDWHDILLIHLNQRCSHLKSVRLCASLLVQSLYPSDQCFSPVVTVTEAQRAKLPVTPMPREMAFPVPKGESWHDHYAHVRFPSHSSEAPLQPVRRSDSPAEAGGPEGSVDAQAQSRQAHSVPRPLPEVSLSSEHSEAFHASSPGGCSQEPSAWAGVTEECAAGSSVTMSTQKRPAALEDTVPRMSFLPDPILRLKRVIGFGGHSTKPALWTSDGAAVMYPCHTVIVIMRLDTWEQRLFLGHTDKVSALALDGSGSLLASAQAQPPSMLRLWDFQTGRCLSLLRSPVHMLCALSFSSSRALLCGVGRDHHGRMVVVAWGTDRVGQGGEVLVLAKAHTDTDVQAFEVAFFDETRMASCGRGSVRLWRLCGQALRSCPVDLGEYQALEFTDLAFRQAQDSSMLYVCGSSGHILEIDPQCMAVWHARRLLPVQTPSRPLPQKQTFSSAASASPRPCVPWALRTATCTSGPWTSLLCSWKQSTRAPSARSTSAQMVRVCCPPPARASWAAWMSPPGSTVCWHAPTPPQCWPSPLSTVEGSWPLCPRITPFASGTWRPCSSCMTSRHPRKPRAPSPSTPRSQPCSVASTVGLSVLSAWRPLRSWWSTGVTEEPSPAWLPAPTATSCSAPALGVPWSSTTVLSSAATSYMWQLLQVDVSALDLACRHQDSAVAVCFGPAPPDHLLVSTASNTIVVLDTVSGRVVQKLPGASSGACSSLAVSGDARLLLTAACRAIKVWDYSMQAGPACQVYIGHSEPVQALASTPNQQQLLSAGDAVFFWDILAPLRGRPQKVPVSRPGSSLPLRQSGVQDSWRTQHRGPVGSLGSRCPCPPRHPHLSRASAIDHPRVVTVRAGPGGWQGMLLQACGAGRGGQRLCAPLPTAPLPQALSLCQMKKRSLSGVTALRGPIRPQAHPRWGRRPAQPETRPGGLPVSAAGSPGARSRRSRAGPATRQDSYQHFVAPCKASPRAKSISPAPGGGWLHLKAVVGYSGNGRANVVWGPDTGFFAYMCGCLVVVEDLHSGAQRHWPDHPKAISTLALSHDAQILASALGCSGSTPRGQIRIWDVPWGSSRQLASHHDAAMQALAFSPDDGLLVALGDYLDCTLALWSMATYELLSFTRLLEPVHGMAFNPWDAGELACVGPGAVTLWLVQQHGADISLQVHRDPIPEEVAAGTLTSVCYGTVPLLYGGSNTGQVCVWDMQAHRCFLAWEADDGEIGGCPVAPSRSGLASPLEPASWVLRPCVTVWAPGQQPCHPCPRGVLLCSGARLVSSNNTRRLRLWAVGAVPELRCRGSGARFGSVLRELELTLDGAIVSVVFHDSMDMGVVGTTAGTLWFISWAEGSSTHLISGHRSKLLAELHSRQHSFGAFSPSRKDTPHPPRTLLPAHQCPDQHGRASAHSGHSFLCGLLPKHDVFKVHSFWLLNTLHGPDGTCVYSHPRA